MTSSCGFVGSGKGLFLVLEARAKKNVFARTFVLKSNVFWGFICFSYTFFPPLFRFYTNHLTISCDSKTKRKRSMPPRRIDWAAIRQRLPAQKGAEQQQKRKELFKQFDPNGNGYLSLAEVDKGCRDVLQLYEIFDCKPVIMRAFMASKEASNKRSKPGSHGPDYVEFSEFRLLLVYLRQYFEIWQMFDEIDTSDDRRIELAEFKKAIPRLATWGVKITNPEAAFKEIDRNGGGIILFDEFADWALRKQLDLEDDDD